MKWVIVLSLLAALVLAQDGLNLAEPCSEECQLPDCRCSSTNIPGGLAPRDTPQFVMLTFDDGINVVNIETYRAELFNRFNRNGCPIGTTFYVSHEYTNYQIVNELYNNGFEIALHSITHQTPQTYWAEADYETLMREVGDQRAQIAHFANIPIDSIRGVRLPFLQMAGNASFEMMASVGLQYDSSWVTTSFTSPGLWPYTLDYASTQDCVVHPCPTASVPGIWVSPMVAWLDLNNVPCSMADSCFFTPPLDDEDAWFRFMVGNFERQYLGNRAPFGVFMHEAYFTVNPTARNAYRRFVDLLMNLDDVFLVNTHQVIDWVRDPIPVDEYKERPCRQFQPAFCQAASCGPLSAAHTDMEYWMQICAQCPNVYPWLGNPMGQ